MGEAREGGPEPGPAGGEEGGLRGSGGVAWGRDGEAGEWQDPGHPGCGVQRAWEEGKSGRREARGEGRAVAQRMTKFCLKVGDGVAELGSRACLGHGITDSGMPRESSSASVRR